MLDKLQGRKEMYLDEQWGLGSPPNCQHNMYWQDWYLHREQVNSGSSLVQQQTGWG